MNWSNVNLEDNYEKDQNMLDPYNFDTLLLEVYCNIRKEHINKETVRKQFNTVLQSKIDCAKEIFEDNLDNIVKKAISER